MPFPQTVISRSIAAVALSTLVAGCSGSDAPDPKPTVLKATTAPATTAPTPTTPPSNRPLRLGDTFINRVDDPAQGEIEVNVTVSKYLQPAKADYSPAELSAGEKGDEWAALEVKVCLVKGSVAAGTNSWQLATADGVRYRPQFFPAGGPKPEFVDGSKLAAGDCLRGNIMFAVPKGTRPGTAVYAPASLDEPKKWTLGQPRQP
ncbi:hypothetical protein [Streptomyces sp. NPDC051921]|uniref:hypothetical protein n=1 Tax=Streptomyces sp. NPDC051921 TaxID=3155806 RepID=UPI003425F08C